MLETLNKYYEGLKLASNFLEFFEPYEKSLPKSNPRPAMDVSYDSHYHDQGNKGKARQVAFTSSMNS